MRVGVNLQGLNPGAIGGLETYVRSLLEWIPGIDRDVTLVLFCVDRNVATLDPGPNVEIHELTDRQFVELGAADLAPHRLDVWWCPLLTLEPAAPGLPTVVTIPDLQHESYPEFFTAELLEWRRANYLRTVRDADRILTISDFSKREIVEHFQIPPARVVAAHLDASRSFLERPVDDPAYLAAVKAHLSLPDRYFYYPANDWPHKNHEVLFEALARFRARGVEPPQLLLTGARVDGATDWGSVLQRLDLGRSVRHLGHVPSGHLPAIHAQADALVFPSLFEGFGIPVVEAMRARCPVICSDRTSLPEIGGDAVRSFDPTDPDDLFAHLWAIWDDGRSMSGLRGELIAAGLQQARAFSWRSCAGATLDVMRAAAGTPRAPISVPPEQALPSITIVTPSLDQGRFIERTLDSVLGQGYPNVQHLVIDGGSTDDTVAILERYRSAHPGRLEYVSEPDRGQAHAVNKGLDKAGGDIVGWVNSDDVLAPGALHAVAAAFGRHPSWEVVFGNAAWITEDDAPIAPYPTQPVLDRTSFESGCPVCQPTVFLRRSVVDRGVRLDEDLHWCMDYELWIRLIEDTPFHFLDRSLADSRIHTDTKSVGHRHAVFGEIFATTRRHYGHVPAEWILGRADFVCRGDPSFVAPPTIGPKTYRRAVTDLVRYNWRSPRFVWGELTQGHGRRWLREAVRR